MQSLIKELHEPVIAKTDWLLPALRTVSDDGEDDTEVHAALRQAEQVIRAQEERIRLLETMALTDELTGLANRRGFALAFERELSLARRDASFGGVLVVLDLDGFKAVNDRYGHQAGDAYLCAVSQVLHETIRASDTAARLGGDEFAVLLSHMDEKFGVARLAKLEKTFSNHSLPWNGHSIPLRASFGFAAYNGSCSADTVMHAADVRLYARKSHGRKAITGGAF